MSQESFPKDIYDIRKKLSKEEFIELCDRVAALSTGFYSDDDKTLIQRLEFINYATYVVTNLKYSTDLPIHFLEWQFCLWELLDNTIKIIEAKAEAICQNIQKYYD